MSDFIKLYLETGMIGLVGIMFCYFIISLSRKADRQQTTLEQMNIDSSRQTDAIKNAESIIIKLIDRCDSSDEIRDRRHEDLVKEIHDLSSDIHYLKGRINGN